jgi:signal transduction histidine kinase
VSRRLLFAAAATGVAVATAAAVLPVVVPAEPLSALRIFRHVAIGVAWIAAGLVAAWRRPGNRTGALLAAVGFLWFLPDVEWWHSAVPFTLVNLLGDLYLAVAAHAVLAFPNGRLSSRLERTVVAAAYIDALVVANLAEPFRDPRLQGCTDCPHNLALVHGSKSLTDSLDLSSTVLQALIAAAVVALLLRRWQRATPPARRVIAPVLWSGALVAALQVALAIQPGDDNGTVLGSVAGIAFNVFPLAFLAGLLWARLHRGAIAQLVIELGAAPSPGDVRAPLARALGDPSLELAFSLPTEDRYVAPDGTPFEVPNTTDGRAVTVLEHDGWPIAALVHDPSLLEDNIFLDAVAAAAALALENARLQAELRAQLAEVRASRARILAAGDEERRRLERDLHDGAQQRLLATRLALRLVRDRTARHDAEIEALLEEADAEVQGALDEIRAFARGLHPALLSEEGLAAALAVLARRSPIPVEITAAPTDRLPAAVETAAYFLAAEALANAAKHAVASRVRINIERQDGQAVVLINDDGIGGASATIGGGLSGLRDRIEALGGRFALESPAGGGTQLRAEIPCA